jgi:hypothetical protein
MKITSKPMALVILIVLFGGIAVTTWLGWWATETSKVPVTYPDGELAGQYNPADIRGSYSFGDVSELFIIPIEDLQLAFHLPVEDPAGFDLKSLEALYGDLETEIGTASVRLFVARYKGLPYEPTEETYLMVEGVEILKLQGHLTPDQLAYLESHRVDLSVAAPVAATPPILAEATPSTPVGATPAATLAGPQTTPAPVETVHAPPDRTITGKTTFQNLLDWGVQSSDIEQVLGRPMPAADTIIKNYVTGQGLEFSAIKNALQTLVDQVNP